MIKITFSGDIMLKPKVLKFYRETKKYNFREIFEDINKIFVESDFVVGNLETPVSENISELKFEQYRFTSPIQFAQAVKEVGFNLVTTANNHCLDNGMLGAKSTVECLNKINLDNTGISVNERRTYIKEISGKKIAFLSYTYGTNAFSNDVYIPKHSEIKVNLFQNQELSNPFVRFIYKNQLISTKIIRKILRKLGLFQLKKQVYERKERSLLKKKILLKEIKKCREMGVDYIVMCLHIGAQYSNSPTKYSKKMIKFLLNNNVDMIIGNHEHVIHNCEISNNKLIAYCLGNFIGTAGVLEKPFDKMAEYSILVHTYLNEKNTQVNLERATFSIVKTILDKENGDKALKVKLLYDMIKECKDKTEKEKLLLDYNKICKIVLDSPCNEFELRQEVEIKLM